MEGGHGALISFRPRRSVRDPNQKHLTRVRHSFASTRGSGLLLMSFSKLAPLDDFHYNPVTMVDPILDALVSKVFNLCGITLREWQMGAVYCLLKKNDLLVKAGTGAGKSWVFWSMALSRPRGIVLVLAPLKVIMNNHVRDFDSCVPTNS